MEDNEVQEKEKPRRQPGRSMFGPILLIALGVLLLLVNFGRLPELNWQAALRLWPLLLIFIGLNIIVRQVPRPLGSWLSLLVALVTVGVFGYVLLFSGSSNVLNSEALWSPGTAKVETLSFPADDVQEASISIDLNAAGADVFALRDSRDLIEADVSYNGELIFEHDASGGTATVHLETIDNQGIFFWANPETWFSSLDLPRWSVGLDPTVMTDLSLILSSGPADLNLSGLKLNDLSVDGASGSADVILPEGDYDTWYDVGSGSVTMTLPSGGEHEIIIDGGSGSLTLIVPNSIEVYLKADMGSGGFHVSDDRFQEVLGADASDQNVWQTENYGQGQDQVELLIDAGSGSVRVLSE